MNTDNCSLGWATDESFLPGSLTGLCNEQLIVYDTLFPIFVIFRLTILIFGWYDWSRRRLAFMKKAANAVDKRVWQHRIPVGPLVNTLITVIWIIVLVLLRLNISNSSNGVTFLLWTTAFNGYATLALMFLRRLVKLGKKVIPMWRANFEKFGEDQLSEGAQSRTDELAVFDNVLVGIAVILCLSMVTQTVSGLVLGLVFPGQFIWLQLGYACEAGFIFTMVTALTYQLQRVYRCVLISDMDEKTKSVVCKKLRSQQMHLWTMGYGSAVVNVLLTVGVVPSRWYAFIYWIIVDSSASSLAVMEMIGSLCLRRKPRANTQTAMVTAVATVHGNTSSGQ